MSRVTVSSGIWEDADFIELQDSEKLIVFWAVTKCDPVGYVEVSGAKLRRDMQAGMEAVEGACKGVHRSLVRTKRGIWLRNFIRHQFGRGSSLVKSNACKPVLEALAEAPEDVVQLVLGEYAELSELFADSKGLDRDLEGASKGLDKVVERANGHRHPSLDEAKSAAVTVGVLPDEADQWWNAREASGWLRASNGVAMPVGKNWHADMRTYILSCRQRESERGPGKNATVRQREERKTGMAYTGRLKEL